MRVKLFDSQAKAKEVLEHNQPRLVRLEDKEICLVRINEDLYAFQNSCSHMGEALHRGKINYLHEIVCPLHTYRFKITTGEEAHHRCMRLKTYPIVKLPDGVFIEY